MTFSKLFDSEFNVLTGLYFLLTMLSSELNIWTTAAVLDLFGKVISLIFKFMTAVRGLSRTFADICNILGGILLT